MYVPTLGSGEPLTNSDKSVGKTVVKSRVFMPEC